MNLKQLLFTVLMVLAVAFAAVATSTYYVSESRVVTIQFASAATTAGSPVIKCTSKAGGAIVGVALNTAVAGADVQVCTEGVFDLTVSADGDGVVVGDYVFAAIPGIGTGTTTLGETNTNVIFGQALEAVTNGTSDRIKVRLMQSGD